MAEVCESECAGRRPGDEPLILKRWHSCELPQLYKAFEGWKSVCAEAHNFCSFLGMMRADPARVCVCVCVWWGSLDSILEGQEALSRVTLV